MADNYLSYSFSITIPGNAKEAVENVIDKFTELIESGELESGGYNDVDWVAYGSVRVQYDTAKDRTYVYIYNEESGDVEQASEITQRIVDEFFPYGDGSTIIEYAFTCSKPRTGEFGGGAVLIRSKMDPVWVNPLEILSRVDEGTLKVDW